MAQVASAHPQMSTAVPPDQVTEHAALDRIAAANTLAANIVIRCVRTFVLEALSKGPSGVVLPCLLAGALTSSSVARYPLPNIASVSTCATTCLALCQIFTEMRQQLPSPRSIVISRSLASLPKVEGEQQQQQQQPRPKPSAFSCPLDLQAHEVLSADES
eukprot:1158601-Pelagomonas_calceolata.AAC.3